MKNKYLDKSILKNKNLDKPKELKNYKFIRFLLIIITICLCIIIYQLTEITKSIHSIDKPKKASKIRGMF